MKKVFIAISLMIASSALFAQEKNFIDQNYIEITATAEKEVAPDEIYLNITIEEKDNKNKSLEKQEKEMFKKLEDLGIDLKKDMQIKDMSTLLQEYFLKKNSVTTTKSYQLRVRSTDLLIKVFSELERLSIPNVSIVKTEVSNKEEIKDEVMVMAAKKAMNRAEKLAASLGRKLGKAIYIQHSEGFQRNISLRGYASGMKVMNAIADEGSQIPDLSYQKITFEQSIYIRFSLE